MYLVVDEITENPMVLDEPLDLSSTIPATDDTDLVIPESVRELRFRGTARKEADRVLLAGRLTGALELRCARCLATFRWPLDVEVSLTLVGQFPVPAPDVQLDEEEVRANDASFYEVTDGKVDLKEIAAEHVILSLPAKPLCADNCCGLCPQCGTDRNKNDCDCSSEETDPRLAPLKALKDRWQGSDPLTGGD